MSKQGPSRRRLVLLTSPFQGHISPMLQLGAVLHSNGFSITIVHTQFNSPNHLHHSDFNFVSINEGLSDEDIASLDLTAVVLVLNSRCESPFRECLAQLIQHQEAQDEIACVIYDALMYCAEAATYSLKLPSIMFRTSSATTFLSRSFLCKLWEKGCIPDPMSEEPVQEYPPLRLRDLPISCFGPMENFFKLMANSHDIKRSSAIVYNSMTCLEESSLAKLQQQFQVPIFAIGPIHKIVPAPPCSLLEEDTGCISWLNRQTPKSVIYISIGSLASTSAKELFEMAWGFANSRLPFLWVVRPGSVPGSEQIESISEGLKQIIGDRGCIVKWAPQKEVLGHYATGAFWSHCGWNSLLESICEGVPMICRPSFGDQKVNARYVSQVWRVGLQLENELERGGIERVVRRVTVDKEGEEMRQRAMDLKGKAENCIRKGGSSYNSLKELVGLITSFQ